MSRLDSKSSFLLWLMFVGAGLVLAYAAGRLDPHYVDDSDSYLNYEFESLEGLCRLTRMPGYPLWLLVLTNTVGIALVPAAQVIVHATAVWLLYRELGLWGISDRARMAVAIAIGVGCTAMDHIGTVSTDAICASLGVMTATALLRWARLDEAGWRGWLPVVLAAVAAIFVRPAYLFLIPWVLVSGAMLRHLRGVNWMSAFRCGFTVSLVALLPVLAWMTLRLVMVGDFGLLPFGHQNLSGIVVQLVSDEELKEVGGELGAAIVESKNRYDREIGLAEGDIGATMTIDARWDVMTWVIVTRTSRELADGDVVAAHRATAQLNKAIISHYPQRYVLWLMKAARRGAWAIAADIVMHPLFLTVIGLTVLWLLWTAIRGEPVTFMIDNSVGLRALTIITFTYLIAKVGFVILTSPPIGRFSDAAAIFLPAWLAAVLVSAIRRDANDS